MEPTAQFNCGLAVCYEVKLYLASLMEKMAVGEILEFISTDPHAKTELFTWAEWRNYEVLSVDYLDENRIRFLIRR